MDDVVINIVDDTIDIDRNDDLYHAIENTANQNTGKPLYSTEPSHRSVQFNGITPNLPIDQCNSTVITPNLPIDQCNSTVITPNLAIVHRIDYVMPRIFYDMV